MKRIVVLTIILSMIISGTALGKQILLSTIKQEILISRTLHTPIPPISPRYPKLTMETAYMIQNWLIGKLSKLRHAHTVGFKVAFTSPPSQKKFKTNEPAYGILLNYMELHNNAVIDHKKILKPFVEVEVGFRFGKSISKSIKNTNELKKYVDAAFPAIEIPSIRFSTLKGITAADVVADDVGTAYFIVGKMVKPNLTNLNLITSVLYHNGKIVRTGRSKAVLGSPWKSLLWLVNSVLKSGRKIKKGYLVITGTMTKLYPLKPGKYLAVHGRLGYIRFTVK